MRDASRVRMEEYGSHLQKRYGSNCKCGIRIHKTTVKYTQKILTTARYIDNRQVYDKVILINMTSGCDRR